MTFNAQAARAKRPCPIWVDAFQRDTQHLEADEIGAYFLILMAMWTRESCDFPDDDSRLARVSRVSTRLWKSRIGPTIRAFLTASNGTVQSKRLREEATYVERQVKQQSDRKTGEKSDKPLECIEPSPSADETTDEPRNYPSQQPNNLQDIPLPDGNGGDAPDGADPKKQFWDNAKAYLQRNGVSAKNAGSFVGKCLREHGLDRSRDAFRAAQADRAAEPIPWITASLTKPEHQPAINDNVIRLLNEQLGIADERRIS